VSEELQKLFFGDFGQLQPWGQRIQPFWKSSIFGHSTFYKFNHTADMQSNLYTKTCLNPGSRSGDLSANIRRGTSNRGIEHVVLDTIQKLVKIMSHAKQLVQLATNLFIAYVMDSFPYTCNGLSRFLSFKHLQGHLRLNPLWER
jgi:hypothetical protein